jgi:hypothetical protein
MSAPRSIWTWTPSPLAIKSFLASLSRPSSARGSAPARPAPPSQGVSSVMTGWLPPLSQPKRRASARLVLWPDPPVTTDDQQAAPPPFRDEAAPAVRISQQEKTGDHRDEPARVKQAVRHQSDGHVDLS